MFTPLMQIVTACLLWLCATVCTGGTVLQYHHVSATSPPSTSVTPAQFAEHLSRLRQDRFRVVRLDVLLDRVRAGEDTRDQVAITFDDGYASLAENALPLLAQYGWNAALFVSTAQVGGAGMLTRTQLQAIHADGHLVLNHGHRHLHVVRRLSGESRQARIERVKQDLLVAQQWLEQALPAPVPRIHAWPYGEHDAATRALADKLGFTALAQLSGALAPQADWQALPRIAVNRRYADWNELRDKLRAVPLPATVKAPQDGVTADPRPQLTLEVTVSPTSLNCFTSGQPQPLSAVRKVSPQVWQVDLVPGHDLDPGRHRVTCTRALEDGRFQWFSWLWMVRGEAGWYPEY